MNIPGNIRINHVWYTHESYRSLLYNESPEPWLEPLVDFLDAWFNEKNYIEVQTSGSTGQPKIIRLLKEHMVNSASMTCNFFHLNEESTALLCLPADYIAGKMMLVRAMVSGFDLIAVAPSANPFQNLRSVIDFTAITPYQFINSYQMLRETPIKKMIVGGSQVSLKLRKLMEDLDIEMYETYGMTETCSHIALRKLNGQDASEYFKVLPGIEIKQDARNCLVIDAPGLSSETLVTNDVVEMTDGSHFNWLGRFDHVINTGGIKVFPEQVEKKIEPFFDRRFFIGSLPHEQLNEQVVLILEGEPLTEKALSGLNNQFETVLNKFEIPRKVFNVEEFETSSSGKILKSKILEKLK